MSDEVTGCACCGPPTEDNTPPVLADGVAPETCCDGSDTGSAHGSESPIGWIPRSCTLPAARQPSRVAEFEALFTGALRTVHRTEPTRLRLVLDPSWQDTVRDLAERESRCCSSFTFTVQQRDDELRLDITVPPARQPLLDVLAQHAATTSPEVTP